VLPEKELLWRVCVAKCSEALQVQWSAVTGVVCVSGSQII